ncbi:MAG: FAD-binding oxidoreductase [Aestuariivirgaceae bacterium]
MTAAPSADTLRRLARITGAAYALTEPEAMQPYLSEPRQRWHGRAAMVLRPRTTAEVAAILAIADATGTAIVPQSGNTGLVGGQIASASGHEVVLVLDRMTAIRDIDTLNDTLTVEAGVTLAAVQQQALAVDRLFPLSLASEGSCRVGGVLATNAGGVAVLTYGNARNLCLGLEVVLADGRVWSGLNRLRKDNTGYDLKQLFIGSEGTLGVITAAVLRLFPAIRDRATAFAALATPDAALALFTLARDRAASRLTAFELIPRIGLDFTIRHAGCRDPLAAPAPWYVLIELTDQASSGTLEDSLAAILEQAVERGLVGDAAIAASAAQINDFWRIRESLSEVQKHEGASIKHDVSVPLSNIARFIDDATAAVLAIAPLSRPVPFGHLGDGNIHFNVSQPAGADRARFLGQADQITARIYEVVQALDGSISAEHGIGQMKRALMPRIKSPVELAMMRAVKQALDPKGLLNPGKLLP